MKKLSNLLVVMALTVAGLNAQLSVSTPYDPSQIPAQAVPCAGGGAPCARLFNPYDVNNALHSTENWGGTLVLAQRITLPVLPACGYRLGAIEVPTFVQGFTAIAGNFELWTSAGNVPGALIHRSPDYAVGFVHLGLTRYDVPTAVAGTLNQGTSYWISFYGLLPAGSGTGNPRVFWGMTSPAANQANGNVGMACRYSGAPFGGAACPAWTTVAACAAVAAFGQNGLGYDINLCAGAGGLVIGGNPVPTMTQWGLFLFGLVLLTLAVVTVFNFSRRGKIA